MENAPEKNQFSEDTVSDQWGTLSEMPPFGESQPVVPENGETDSTIDFDKQYVEERLNKIEDEGKRDYAIALLPVLFGANESDNQNLTSKERDYNKHIFEDITKFLASGRTDSLSRHLKNLTGDAVDDGNEMVMLYSAVGGRASVIETGNIISKKLESIDDGNLQIAVAEVIKDELESEMSLNSPNDQDNDRLELQIEYSKQLINGEVSDLEKDMREGFARRGLEELREAPADDIKTKMHEHGVNGWIWANDIDKKVKEYSNDYKLYEDALGKGKTMLGDYVYKKPESGNVGAKSEELDASIIV